MGTLERPLKSGSVQLTWLRLWSGYTRQPLWVAFVRTLAISAPSCPASAVCLGTVWRRMVPDVNDHMVSGLLDWVTLLELSVCL